MNIIEKYRKSINELCDRYYVKQLYAFGSVLNNAKFQESSDVDLIVNFETGKIEDYANNYYQLKFALEDIFKRPVDLLEEKALKNPYFINSVTKERQLVYG